MIYCILKIIYYCHVFWIKSMFCFQVIKLDWTFLGHITDYAYVLWGMLLPFNLVYNINICAASLCVQMCDHVEDGWLFAGYCCLSCPSSVVSIIGLLRLALSCYSLGSRRRRRRRILGVDVQLRKTSPIIRPDGIQDHKHVTDCLPLQQASCISLSALQIHLPPIVGGNLTVEFK